MGGWDASTTEPFSDSSLDDQVVDTLMGGVGNDTYVLLGTSFRSGAPDTIVDAENEGDDTVLASISYTLGDHVENLTLRGEQAIDGSGNVLANVLVGNSANNQLAGGAGIDRLVGGESDDTYLFNLGDGVDTISDIARAAEGNRIRFGDGIAQDDLTLTQSQHALTIQVGSGPSSRSGSLLKRHWVFCFQETHARTIRRRRPVTARPFRSSVAFA